MNREYWLGTALLATIVTAATWLTAGISIACGHWISGSIGLVFSGILTTFLIVGEDNHKKA